jgi:23S rRNA G2069 N7-methylase RlmK/C1962 C5-methylase RlmI
MKLTQEQAFAMLAERLEHARKEHQVFARDEHDATSVIYGEWDELAQAVGDGEGPVRVIDEALDVAATAMRLVMGEVEG